MAARGRCFACCALVEVWFLVKDCGQTICSCRRAADDAGFAVYSSCECTNLRHDATFRLTCNDANGAIYCSALGRTGCARRRRSGVQQFGARRVFGHALRRGEHCATDCVKKLCDRLCGESDIAWHVLINVLIMFCFEVSLLLFVLRHVC